eukprot:scaffold82015_cov16-Tisochrysis_lutea.AAC.1
MEIPLLAAKIARALTFGAVPVVDAGPRGRCPLAPPRHPHGSRCSTVGHQGLCGLHAGGRGAALVGQGHRARLALPCGLAGSGCGLLQ